MFSFSFRFFTRFAGKCMPASLWLSPFARSPSTRPCPKEWTRSVDVVCSMPRGKAPAGGRGAPRASALNG